MGIKTPTSEEIGIKIKIEGIDAIPHFNFIHENPMLIKTLYTQLMLERNILAGHAVYVCYAHINEAIIDEYKWAFKEAMRIISIAIKNNAIKDLLKYPIAESGFKRLI